MNDKTLIDTVDSDTFTQAAVEAALREAADACAGAAWKHEGDDAYSRGLDKGALEQVKSSVAAIRALIPDTGALDRALEKAREEGRREGQIEAGAVFATSDAEANWIADMENACPACGGSGHKGDGQ